MSDDFPIEKVLVSVEIELDGGGDGELFRLLKGGANIRATLLYHLKGPALDPTRFVLKALGEGDVTVLSHSWREGPDR